MSTPARNNNHVKSVQKAFAIIDVLSEAGEMSIGELSRRLMLDKATVHRLINTIKAAGYIIQNEETKKYSNSLKLFAIGQKLVDKMALREIARPFMKELLEITGETVSLGVGAGASVIYIDRMQSPAAIKVGVTIGSTVPQYCSGMGKAILAFTHKETQEDILSEFHMAERFTPNTLTEVGALRDCLQEVYEKGYAIDDEEYVIGLVCIGAPIFNYDGEPIAAISVSCLTLHHEKDEPEHRYANIVKRMAGNISMKLGYSGDYLKKLEQ
ncbi:IclR family transcriptional regulator [Clostridia bacterium]|nr:IclR family transcriptional regulator [Clostridia bacterium]